MSTEKKDDTQKIQVNKSSAPSKGETQRIKTGGTQTIKVKKPKLWRVIVVGILFTLLLGAGGGLLGYRQGITDRLTQQNEKILSEAALQYQYGLQELANGNYSLARSHFEYVMEVYPDFPGLTEKYTEVMLQIAQTSKPTPTPAPTGTPDTRGTEALFAQATQEVQSKQWASALQTLEALRNADYTYRTLEVDGLYYITLRYRAVDMIVAEGNLEEGMYYLSVLERYAPLDRDAVNYYNVARLYITGASYWDLDWKQVVTYFDQLYAALPSLYDGTMTASERYFYALGYYADQLMDDNQPCEAENYYQKALNISSTDTLQSSYNKAYKQCHPPTATPTEEVIVETQEPTEETTEIPPETSPEASPDALPEGELNP